MKKMLIAWLLVILVVGFESCASGYCVGGKSKYKKMKRDTNSMIF